MKIQPFLVTLCLSLASLAHSASEIRAIRSHPSPYPVIGHVIKLDPALDDLLAPGAQIQKLAEGFSWSEGPLWLRREQQLVFSDVTQNVVYRWRENGPAEIYLRPSGYTGALGKGAPEGSNGLALDLQGRLLLAQHGDRRVARLNEDQRTFTTLVDRINGKKFNSPNDLCVDRRGNIYFTDPPYGLKDGVREIDSNGVYVLGTDGSCTLLTDKMERPNGLALSPDEKTLYVANSHEPRPIIMAIPLGEKGAAGPGRVFFDASEIVARERAGSMDGVKVDTRGNLWATGPGGVLVLDANGKLLGRIQTGQLTANCCFGGPGGNILYITAANVLCRIETKAKGAGL